MGSTFHSGHRDSGLLENRMYLFVLTVWLWTVWLPFVAYRAYMTVKASREDLPPPLVYDDEDE
jgi:hypothetical protein